MKLVKPYLLQPVVLVLLIFLLLAPYSKVFAREGAPTKPTKIPIEDKVKAAFLYNFLKMVKWPEDNSSDKLSVCFVAKDSFGKALNPLRGKRLKKKEIEVKNIKFNDIMHSNCSILYIGVQQKANIESVLSSVNSKPILVVSDINNFVMIGGAVGFVTEKGKVRFDINTKIVSDAGLKISSKILELAREVY